MTLCERFNVNKKTIFKLVLLISFLFCAYLVIVNNSFTSCLEPRYIDSLRHQRFAFEFFNSGFEIFSTPLKDLAEIGNPAYYTGWKEFPEFYPLGAVLFFMPFGFLAFNGIMDPIIINKSILIIFLIFAHLDVYLFITKINDEGEEKGIAFLISLLFYLFIILWSLNGQYEAIPLLFILLGIQYIKENKNLLGIFFYALALTFKYQALILLPIFSIPILKIFIKERWTILSNIRNAFNKKIFLLSCSIFIFILLDLYTFSLSYPFFSNIPIENIISVYALTPFSLNHSTLGFFGILFITILSAFYLFYIKDNTMGLTVIWCFLALILSRQFQMWYILWIFPIIILTKSSKSFRITAIWLIGLLYLLGWIPNYFYIYDLIRVYI